VVNRLRLQLEDIREQELQKALSRMGPDLSARERKVVEALSKGIINKILHTPVTNLRAPQPRQQRRVAMKVIQDLFQLEDGPTG
jgi:glutamyl-tRNA reductase